MSVSMLSCCGSIISRRRIEFGSGGFAMSSDENKNVGTIWPVFLILFGISFVLFLACFKPGH
jgi:hypothetical protein